MNNVIDMQEWIDKKDEDQAYKIYEEQVEDIYLNMTPEELVEEAVLFLDEHKEDDEQIHSYRILLEMLRYKYEDFYTEAAIHPDWEKKVVSPITDALTRRMEK